MREFDTLYTPNWLGHDCVQFCLAHDWATFPKIGHLAAVCLSQERSTNEGCTSSRNLTVKLWPDQSQDSVSLTAILWQKEHLGNVSIWDLFTYIIAVPNLFEPLRLGQLNSAIRSYGVSDSPCRWCFRCQRHSSFWWKQWSLPSAILLAALLPWRVG